MLTAEHPDVRVGSDQRLLVCQKFALLAIVLSPFQKALTIDLGFPLKPSEILLALSVLAAALGPRLPRSGQSVTKQWRILLGLGGLVVFSALIASGGAVPAGRHYGYERSLGIDMMLYIAYAALVILSWRIVVSIRPRSVLRAMAWAVRLAFAFCAIQLYAFETGANSVIKRIGFEMVIGRAYPVYLPRNGPFYEGNNLGIFAVFAILMMTKRRDRIGLLCGFGCLIYSQSTNALLGLIGGGLVAAFVMAAPRWRFRLVVCTMFTVIGVWLVPTASTFVRFQAAKIGVIAPRQQDSGTDISRSLRGAKTRDGFRLAAEHPLVGVGPGRFGIWFDAEANPADYPPRYLEGGAKGESRSIAENGYMQLSAEIGFPALLLLLALLYVLIRRLRRGDPRDFALTVAVALMMLGAAAWTLLTIWLALAYLGSVSEAKERDETGHTTDPNAEDASELESSRRRGPWSAVSITR